MPHASCFYLRLPSRTDPLSQRYIILIAIISTIGLVHASFTRHSQWKMDEIDQTLAGAWCFKPGPSPSIARDCTNHNLSTLLDGHVKNDRGLGLSIVYYDLHDGSVLGGAGWFRWEHVALPIAVCMSGAVTGVGSAYRTICRLAMENDDHDRELVHEQECSIDLPQRHVIDCCYEPPPRKRRFRLDDTSDSAIALLGLIIALPSVMIGLWKCHRSQQQCRQERERLVLARAAGRRGPQMAELFLTV